jgi:hypothetical protein
MLLMAPFGLLPYLPAYILWTALGILALCWAAPRELKRSQATLALLLAPAGLLTLICGQNAFFAAAIVAGIFRWLDQRPVLAGLLLGLLTVKPQLGLVFPLMLILTARWTVFLSAAATAIALAGATALLFGADVWSAYVLIGIPLQEYVIADPTEPIKGMMPTAYMNARLIGLSANVAYVVQACFAVGSLAAVVWAYWRRRDPLPSYAVLVIAGLAATPYLMSYDLAVVSWIILALIGSGAVSAADRPMLLAVVFLPFLAIAGGLAGVPGSALILPLFVMFIVPRMLASSAGASSAANGLSRQGNTSGGTGYQSCQSSQTTSVAPRSYS